MQEELLSACCVISSIEEKLINTSPNASVELFRLSLFLYRPIDGRKVITKRPLYNPTVERGLNSILMSPVGILAHHFIRPNPDGVTRNIRAEYN